MTPESSLWPELPFPAWRDTAETLHLWTQIVGKVRLVQTPWLNHSWHVTLYVTPRGLTTGIVPHGDRSFQMDFDFFDHVLRVDSCEGARETVTLAPRTTASFFDDVMGALERVGRPVAINVVPNELEDPIPFPEDETHASYAPEWAHRFWRVLHSTDRVFRQFRAGWGGKASPSHFFWGSFDLAVTRFSGREAPDHPGGLPNLPLWVAQEAYSHEVSSAGFWPGNGDVPEPIFYSYAYPTPEAMASQGVAPAEASWNSDLGEFVLPYEAVRTARDPEATLMRFLESTFEAAAQTGDWDLGQGRRRHFPKRPD